MRICEGCGNEFTRHPTERTAQWYRRRFCGSPCATTHARNVRWAGHAPVDVDPEPVGMIPISRIAPILRKEADKRRHIDETGRTIQSDDRGIMALSASMAGQDRADDSYARRLYVIFNGRDSHGLRMPRSADKPVPSFGAGAGLILSQNDAVDGAMEVQAALDAIDAFFTRTPVDEERPTVLKIGTAYRYVVERGFMRTITHMPFSTVDEIFCRLDMPHVWHSELADLYEEAA